MFLIETMTRFEGIETFAPNAFILFTKIETMTRFEGIETLLLHKFL